MFVIRRTSEQRGADTAVSRRSALRSRRTASSSPATDRPPAQLFFANADGTGERKLLPTAEMDYSPSFSRDGDWIVFTSERQGSADIYRNASRRLRGSSADGRSIFRRSSGAFT